MLMFYEHLLVLINKNLPIRRIFIQSKAVPRCHGGAIGGAMDREGIVVRISVAINQPDMERGELRPAWIT